MDGWMDGWVVLRVWYRRPSYRPLSYRDLHTGEFRPVYFSYRRLSYRPGHQQFPGIQLFLFLFTYPCRLQIRFSLQELIIGRMDGWILVNISAQNQSQENVHLNYILFRDDDKKCVKNFVSSFYHFLFKFSFVNIFS